MKSRNLRLIGLVVLSGLPGLLSMIPASTELLAGLPEPKPPIAIIAIIGTLQGLVLVTLMALPGTFLAHKLGLHAPVLEAVSEGRPAGELLTGQLRAGFPLGLVAGLAIVAFDTTVFGPYLPERLQMLSQRPTAYEIVPALFYGGIVEEILIRWGLMTLIVWAAHKVLSLGHKADDRADNHASPVAIWTGILLAAILFGAGHLPAVAGLLGTVAPVVAVRTVVSNAIPGVLFGWLYARKGLESAMFAHMGTHVGMILLRLILT